MNYICLFTAVVGSVFGIAASAEGRSEFDRARCPVGLTSRAGSPRSNVVTTILKTIPRFAQTNTVVPLLVFVKILDDPSLFGELVSPLDADELERSIRAMNRAHQAFDVAKRSGDAVPWYSPDRIEPEGVIRAVEYFPNQVVEDILDLSLKLEPHNAFLRLMRSQPELRLPNRDLLAKEVPALLGRHGLGRPGSTLEAYHRLLDEIVTSAEFEGFRVRYMRFLKYLIATEGGVTPARRRLMMKMAANGLRRFYFGFAAHRLDAPTRAATRDWFFWWARVI